jgi:cyclopropane-fatty-acyl-phospholipid synthase
MILHTLSDVIVFNALKAIHSGYLEITKLDGSVIKFGNEQDPLHVKIKIKHPGFTYQVIKNDCIGLGESYMNDYFETDNLANLIELGAQNINTIYKFFGLFDFSFVNFIKNKFIKNTKGRSKANIAKHYDLGNNFFSLWLDETKTYSSAIFEDDKQNLSDAQKNKYQKLINLLQPKENGQILEIGCGWGGFAEYLTKNYNVKLDCITISHKQYEFAKERIYKAGLNDKVNIEMKDYRDLKKKYDYVASIEMIEAVGQNYLDDYFRTIKNNLAPEGKVAIQAITIQDNLYDRYKNRQDFIQKYIFPGGFLPSKKALLNYANNNGLELGAYNSYADHYSKTLKLWREKFNEKWNLISKEGFDVTFKKMWEFYLAYCEAGFKSKNIDLVQVSMHNKP